MKSLTNVLYPKLVPLSVIHTSLAASHFESIPLTSQGAKNCPFFIFTINPEWHAASIRSVCLLKKAGI